MMQANIYEPRTALLIHNLHNRTKLYLCRYSISNVYRIHSIYPLSNKCDSVVAYEFAFFSPYTKSTSNRFNQALYSGWPL